MRRQLRLCVVLLAVSACAHIGAPAAPEMYFGRDAKRWMAAHLAERTRVTLVVTNLGDEAAVIYVARAGRYPVRLGVVNRGAVTRFDLTDFAPVGSVVRVRVVPSSGRPRYLVSHELVIVRPGTLVIEIGPALSAAA